MIVVRVPRKYFFDSCPHNGQLRPRQVTVTALHVKPVAALPFIHWNHHGKPRRQTDFGEGSFECNTNQVFTNLFADHVAYSVGAANETQQRTLIFEIDDFNHITQVVAIEPAAGGHYNLITLAALKLMGKPEITASVDELKEMTSQRQRRAGAACQRKRNEPFGSQEPFRLNHHTWKQLCEFS